MHLYPQEVPPEFTGEVWIYLSTGGQLRAEYYNSSGEWWAGVQFNDSDAPVDARYVIGWDYLS